MSVMTQNMNEMLLRAEADGRGYVVAAMYKFVTLTDIETLQQTIINLCTSHQALGTILLANEGINGTIAAPIDGMTGILEWLEADSRFGGMSLKFSHSPTQPFLRMKVRLKREIVTMGCPEISPAERTGTYVEPKDWNALISDPDVLVVDTRNVYETAIGMFDNAVDPMTTNFRDFPDWAARLAEQQAPAKPKKIAMYCTGGIRCEKASALMQDYGFDEVYHLQGGILKYLEDVPKNDSKWQGECFVFDGRVAVDHNLNPGSYGMCHGCRMPLSQDDMQRPEYVEGISCHHCQDTQDPERTARFAERQKQIQLAKHRGEAHLGASPRNSK
ncbi:oxygen-dependent tRNA uridine(34) hydroxylase TrhO [Candidatus Puniceispirillum marinum]|uniref:tRNA uridine(34) hydroxylase n=1 Tax=Puniceispirillum marinum (strain IMCC1322) TaxID=488538 RepID=D5BN70_PUNMI|nr:rhodanese-related sulfurtransferase [Candidatus Puniceispirillum marinum]ADE40263.1 hypothetical protein SAR116_2020 [Candidatus Puniceispirillum marinum IMCC1322]